MAEGGEWVGAGDGGFSFYGIDGKLLETYTPSYHDYFGVTYMALTESEEELYMARRLIGRTNWQYVNTYQPISADPLATVRWDAPAPPNGVTEAFCRGGGVGTCWRDSESSLDCGMNRNYSGVTGRFMTAGAYIVTAARLNDGTNPKFRE